MLNPDLEGRHDDDVDDDDICSHLRDQIESS